MVATDQDPVPFAALTDGELQVLRLLAAGHTVKSIAVSLDRSEASINERLRDARRKSGVGSSRELARLIASQKIWDKKTDLSPPDVPAQVSGQPSPTEVPRSRRMIVMLASVPIAAIALSLFTSNLAGDAQPAASVPVAAATQPLLAGRWSLDIMRIPAEERPQRVIIEFRQSTDRRWTTLVEIVGPDGSMQRAESTAAADGIAVPVTGTMPFIDSVSLRQPDANTLVMSLRKDGAPVSTRVYTAAADGRTMTETIIWPGPTAPGLETTIFRRQD